MEWLLLILASALFLGLYTPLLKHALAHEKNTQILALYPILPLGILALLGRVDYGAILTPVGWLLFLKASVIALTIYSATLALERLPVSIYAPMRNLSPLFLLFLSYLLLGETIGLVQVLGLLMIIGGALLLDFDIREAHHAERLKRFLVKPEMLLILIASFIISFSPIFDRLILRETTPETTLFWYLAILSAIFWLIHMLTEGGLPFTGLERQEYLWIGGIGLTILVADLLYFWAVALPGTILVVIVGTRRLANLISTIIGGKAFHEKHLLYKGSMCLVMILGTILLLL